MLKRPLRATKQLYRRAEFAVKERFGLFDPLEILPFRSTGRRDSIEVKGRVREREPLHDASEDAAVWRNVLNTVYRLESDEIPGARLRLHFQGSIVEAVTDVDGYFRVRMPARHPLDGGWHDVRVELVESRAGGEGTEAVAQVLVPPEDAEFAVVTDMDDTVIRTAVTELFTELRMVFSKNARTRVPFPGVPALYRALQQGPDERGVNPIFYVSRNTWNLYDLFEEFLALHDIPPGPAYFRDAHLVEEPSPLLHTSDHKRDIIEGLLEEHPTLPFVLLGDAGQQDPAIYADVASRHPGRVPVIYIRDVVGAREEHRLQEERRRLRGMGTELILAGDTGRMAADACARGLISRSHLEEVFREALDAPPA